MKRRWWSVVLVAMGGMAAIWGLLLRSPTPINIVLITLDTTRADRLGCYGHANAETPNLDRLAASGLLFERAYAPAPMTLPSHASMFTGLWPPEHGLTTNGQASLDSGIASAAELIRKQGYETVAFVSAFVLQQRFGLGHGFDLYDDDLATAKYNSDELHRSRDGDVTIRSAIRWLTKQSQGQNKSKPFFCWVHLYDPHEPYLPHQNEFGDRFSDQPYDGEIAYTDQLVGRLQDQLDKMGVAKNTCVIVVGDHGESLGEHGELTHGYLLHESTLRVPLIISDPRIRVGGERISQPVSLVDIFPTLLEAARVRVPAEISGQSLWPALARKPIPPRICYSQTDEPYLQAFWAPLRGLTTDQWRYVHTTKPELYDLVADPHELNNLAETKLDVVADLDQQLVSFEEKLRRRAGTSVELSAQERRALESLGYTGGPSGIAVPAEMKGPLPDIKDMIGYLTQLDESLHLIEEKSYDKAAELLEPLALNVPNLLRARLNLGLCRLMQQNYEDAERWLKATLELDPRCDRAVDMLGFTYLKLQRLDLAEEQFKQLLKLKPDSETGHLFLGEVFQRQGNLPMAMHYYQTALKINPSSKAARSAIEVLQQALRSP